MDLTPLDKGATAPEDGSARADADGSPADGGFDTGSEAKVGPPTNPARDLAVGQQTPGRIVVDATTVYWLNLASGGNPGAIMKVAKDVDAGPPQIVVSDVAKPAFCADTLSVFFSNLVQASGYYLARRDKSGAKTVHIYGPSPSHNHCTTQGGRVYGIRSDGKLESVSVEGSSALPVDGVTGATAVAVDGTDIYVATPGKILRVSKAGGSPISFATTSGEVTAIAHDGTSVFWTELTTVRSLAKGSPGATPTDLALAQDAPAAIALDVHNVYFTNFGDGTVRSVPKVLAAPNDSPTTLSTGEGAPMGIAVDDAGLYWTNRDDGRIRVIWR